MEKDWIKIFSSADFFRVELLRQALIEEGVPAVLINKKDSSYGFGQVELFISQENEESARRLMQDMIDEE